MNRNATRRLGALALGLVFATAALAQGAASAPAPGPRMGPSAGMGPGHAGHSMGMHGWRMNADNTPGWAMMTPAERQAHHDKIAAARTQDECKAVMEQHLAQMAERAKAKGRPAPAAPGMDPCARMKP